MKNFKKTTDNVFRGGRPTSVEDLAFLQHLGVRTIVSLQEGWSEVFHTFDLTDEEIAWEKLQGVFHHHRCSNFFPPTKAETDAIIESICEGLTRGKVYVHCYSGVDRTGWICAAYKLRMGWFPDAKWAWRVEAWEKGTHKWFWWWQKHFIALAGK